MYRGELLGLLAIHLILLAVNKLSPTLSGSTQIYSDCLGRLKVSKTCLRTAFLLAVATRPTVPDLRYAIFTWTHVSHQLDHLEWHELSRPEYLNEQCDSGSQAGDL